MPRHLPTPIVVTVVLWNVVHVVEDEAVPVQVLHRFSEAHVEEHGTVEGLVPSLQGESSFSTGVPAAPALCVPPALSRKLQRAASSHSGTRNGVLEQTSGSTNTGIFNLQYKSKNKDAEALLLGHLEKNPILINFFKLELNMEGHQVRGA